MSHSRVFLAACLMLLATAGTAGADEAKEILETGNAAFAAGQYRQAAEQYQKLIARGIDNGHVYYNLGNSWYRLGRYGRAILAYRRALLALPDDADIKANLALARAKIKEPQQYPETAAWYSPLFVLNRHLSQAQLGIGCLLGYCVFWICAALRPIAASRRMKLVKRTGLAAAALLAVPAFGVRPDARGEPALGIGGEELLPAVVTTEEAMAFSGASDSSQVVSLLGEGAEVLVFDRREGWIGVLLPDGRRGWVEKAEIEVV